MASPTRVIAATLSAFAAAVLFAGCTIGPGATAPESTSDPSSGPGQSSDDSDDLEGALLDDGRMFAVITWGSSTCVPQVDQVAAEGQTVSVTLVEPAPEGEDEQACTADMSPRASVGALPEGVDPTKEVALQVTYGDVVDDVELDGDASFTGTPGTSTEYAPTAGWFDDGSLVLLTWGSSSCAPVVESLEASGATGTATFATDDTQVCTMDMAPRATILDFGEDSVDDDAFTLTLVGGGLEGTVEVRG
ncbi:hypothetical protein J7E68_02535 [Microbacterium sp. ISL-103]|uniref:hypothetical protein n=1 Tax=Microbacterium sp. ISL-103 TaxID=2819156 RepID=UPI001BE77027|nr:hypothetical protein [Microbacterium sp. ISL-103]MBT2473479.1 hypothetical protein [Microbacterium sp. ISL-103]